MTHLDLFSGIGGFALAAQSAGFQTIAFSEIEPYACKILAQSWPKVPNLGDITTADWSKFGHVSLLTGGFPCQPFSKAGKRRGKNDDRDLWPAMFGAIKATRADWIVGENVDGFIGMELSRSIADLESAGYTVQPFVIPAYAAGASHERDRIWIVANADQSGRQGGKRGMRKEQPNGYDSPRNIQRFPGEVWSRNNLPESSFCRASDGIPDRTHRLECLGNAIVPQVAEVILKAIAEIIQAEKES